MAALFEEFSAVRLLERHEAESNYGSDGLRLLAAGSVGTIIEVFGNGAAFEVEFTVREPQFDGNKVLDAGTFHVVTLRPDQIEPA